MTSNLLQNVLQAMSLNLAQILAIAFGGALGAVMRYVVSSGMYAWLGQGFPYGTLLVNVSGSFLIGLLSMLLLERFELEPLLRLALIVGFLGAFTTFSTFSLETLNLLNQGAYLKAFVNMLLSVLLSVSAVWFGAMLAKTMVK